MSRSKVVLDRYGRELYSATCSLCGKSTKVPFEPDEERPIYCPSCFANRHPRRSYERSG